MVYIDVLNFDKWRSIFRRNVDNLKINKDVSVDPVRKEHKWDKSMIETEASNRICQNFCEKNTFGIGQGN